MSAPWPCGWSIDRPAVLLVFGGRDFDDSHKVDEWLTWARLSFDGRMAVLQGGARGADRLADEWAKVEGVPRLQMPAPWEAYGKRAGIMRNEWMLKIGRPDAAIGFPGGVGTADMAERCKRAGLPLVLVN